MGTMTAGAVHSVSEASSAAILILVGSKSEHQGRPTLKCDTCGRAQFNKGQRACIACKSTLIVPLEPLCDSDANRATEVSVLERCRRVGFRLRDLRLALEISQRELAIAAGCVRTYITKYENGRVIPTLSSLDRIAGAMRISMGELLDDSLALPQLAIRSMIRAPETGELISSLVSCLPMLAKDSRALLLSTAASLRSPLASQASG